MFILKSGAFSFESDNVKHTYSFRATPHAVGNKYGRPLYFYFEFETFAAHVGDDGKYLPLEITNAFSAWLGADEISKLYKNPKEVIETLIHNDEQFMIDITDR